jgi:hypothetical protein
MFRVLKGAKEANYVGRIEVGHKESFKEVREAQNHP